MAWKQGDTLQGGKFIIEAKLGEGGFGITYKARHTMFDEWVVIKTPNSSLQRDPEYPKFVQRFIKEGQILAKLGKTRHPHIVRVSDLFKEGSLPCLVMDFIEGESLLDIVQRRGALPEAEAIGYIRQIGSALMVVHADGLVHRDAHPGNIMIPKPGEAILIDFGIVGDIFPTTVSSKAFGNPGFAPVEQFRGGRKPTVDIYTLSASLSYAVTGQIPQWNEDQLIPPKRYFSRLSNEINTAILKGMKLGASERPQRMQEWLALLPDEGKSQVSTIPKVRQNPDLLSQMKTPRVVPQPDTKRQQQPKRRKRKIPWVWLLGILLGYAGYGYFWGWFLGWADTWAVALIVAFGTWLGVSLMDKAMAEVVARAWTGVVDKAEAEVVGRALAVPLAVSLAMAMVIGMAGYTGGVVVGVALSVSICWPIAKAMAKAAEELVKSFSPSHTAIILIATYSSAFSLGWLLYGLFPRLQWIPPF